MDVADRIVDRIRRRLDQIRTTGIIPAARMRAEEVVTRLRERVSVSGGLTKESVGKSVGRSVDKKRIRGL